MEFEAPIQEEYYRLVEPQELGNCSIYMKNNKTIWLLTRLDDANEESALRDIAIERFRKVCLAWAIRFDESLLFDESKVVLKAAEPNPNLVFVVSKMGEVDRKFVIDYINKIKNADEYLKKAIIYFERGLATKGSPNDSYLNFFKVLELIADKVFSERDNKKKADFVENTSLKGRISYMCRFLDITAEGLTVDNLVNLRNKNDVGHAKVDIVPIKKSDLDNCMKLAKTVIMKYGHL